MEDFCTQGMYREIKCIVILVSPNQMFIIAGLQTVIERQCMHITVNKKIKIRSFVCILTLPFGSVKTKK